MYRMNFLLVSIGLLAVGCSDTAAPTAQNPDSSPTTVTVNRPVPGDKAPTDQSTPISEQSDEAAQPDPSLLPDDTQGEDRLERARRKLEEAGDAIADWTAESKEKFVEQADERLADLDKKWAEMETKAQDLRGDAQVRWNRDKQQLEEKRQELAQQIDKLKESSGDAWREISLGIAKSFAELKQAAKRAAAELE